MGGTIDLNVNRYAEGSGITVGGFSSEFNGDLSYCFSRINIITRNQYNAEVGGLLGILGADSSIENCYATGSVHSIITWGGSSIAYIGGLVGEKRSGATINDSYALGNVIVDNQSQGANCEVNVGGLVGHNYGDITNSFAAGRVSGKSASNTNGRSYAGGLIGSRSSGIIKDNAVLGASVTAQAPTGRVFARRISGDQMYASDNASNNRAIQSMRVEVGVYTDTYLNNTAPTDGGNYNNEHGRTFADNAFFYHDFWTTGLGFSDEHWDFSKVGIEGFPRLRNVDGQ